MAANEDRMGLIHDATASVLIEALKGQDILDEEGNKVGWIAPTAAMIQAASKFLKDNNITCAPSDTNKMGELQEALNEKNKRRENRRASRAELLEATAEAGFLKGLN